MNKFFILLFIVLTTAFANASHLNIYNYDPISSSQHSTDLYGTSTYYPSQTYKQEFYDARLPDLGRTNFDTYNNSLNAYFENPYYNTTYTNVYNPDYYNSSEYYSNNYHYTTKVREPLFAYEPYKLSSSYYSGTSPINRPVSKVTVIPTSTSNAYYNYQNTAKPSTIYSTIAKPSNVYYNTTKTYEPKVDYVYASGYSQYPRFDEFTDYKKSYSPERKLRLKLTDNGISPNNLTFERNERIRLTVENFSSKPRVFWIEGIDLGSRIVEPQTSVDLVFTTPNSAQALRYYDSVFSERQNGITGTAWNRYALESTQPNEDALNSISISNIRNEYDFDIDAWQLQSAEVSHIWQ